MRHPPADLRTAAGAGGQPAEAGLMLIGTTRTRSARASVVRRFGHVKLRAPMDQRA